MPDSQTDSMRTRLRAMLVLLRDDPRSDEELLKRFANLRDEDAFTVLVGRHGPMVWGACRRVLGEGPDAEDAFQITFLTLTRWAAKLRPGELAGWLFRVARRAAQDVSESAERRHGFERKLLAAARPDGAIADELDQAETYRLLDEELAELPERLRVPVVLRYLEGKTLEEVARILGCSRRAVGKRLARAEEMLRERLGRRGVTVAAGAMGGLLAGTSAVTAVPSDLVIETARAATAFSSGTLNTPAARAALELMPGKAGSAFKTWAGALIAGIVVIGAVAWQATAEPPAPQLAEVPPQDHAHALPVAPAPAPVAALVPTGPVVAGVVNDADGKPVPEADVAVFFGSPPSENNPTGADRVVSTGRAGKDGTFRLVLPASTPTKPLSILAAAPKKAVNAVEVAADALTGVHVRLVDAEPIQGIATAPEKGLAVARARVRVWQVGPIWMGPSSDAGKDPAPPVPFWPTSTTTNEKGEFTLTGLTRATQVSVEVVHPDYARADAPRLVGKATQLTVHLRPPKTVTGRVVAGDPPKPVAGTVVGYEVVRLLGKERRTPLVLHPVGPDGTFKIPVPRVDYVNLHAIPPTGSPFRQAVEQVELNDKEQADVELALPVAKR
jgi:RNA polymerase sigma factor (sigma-70 family)